MAAMGKDEIKLKNGLRGEIRKQFARSESYKSFIKSNRIEVQEGNRLRVFYKCAICSGLNPIKEINVDHIKPIGRGVLSSLSDILKFIDLVYCSHDNLQIVCKPCHSHKTKIENSNPSFDNVIF